MSGHNYDNLEVYKRSLALSKGVLLHFAKFRPYRVAEQICSSAISIPSNISEGAERGTNKEFRRFLEFASGSAAELHTQLVIVRDLNQESTKKIDSFLADLHEIKRMIRGLMKKVGN